MSDSADSPPRVSLPTDIRARLEGRFDLAALEELLATMGTDEQQNYLATLDAGGTPPPGGETGDVTVLAWSSDPARQALLDRVWAPFWEHLPPGSLERTDLPYPGRELARARRADPSAGGVPRM